MAETQTISNTFEALRKDFHPSKVPGRFYDFALNAIRISKKYGGVSDGQDHFVGITRERSTKKFASLPGKVVGYSYIEERDWALFFLKRGSASEIGYVDLGKENSYKKIVADTDYGCTWNFSDCEYLYAEFKNMPPCGEIHMYWSSKCYYYKANIDELLDPRRRAKLTCDDFKLFKCVSGPTISAIPSERGGAGLLAGSYQFLARLRDKDGNTTNTFHLSNPVVVSGDNNKAGEVTNSSISVTLEQLDTRYNQVELFVIKTISGIPSAEKITTRTYNSNGVTVTYNGAREGEPANVIELLTKRKTWIRGQDLIQKGNVLWLYKIRQEINPDLQKKASQAQVYFPVFKVRPEDAKDYMQFPRGERLAVGIVYHHCDGTSTPAFHLSPLGSFGSGYDEALSKATTYAEERLKVLKKYDTAKKDDEPLPTGLETRFSEDGSSGASSSGSGSVDGYKWEEEDEFVGFERDVIENIRDNVADTDSSYQASGCVDCDQEKYREGYEVTEKSDADFGDFVSDGVENNLPKDSAKNTSNSLTDAIKNLVDKLLAKKYKRRKKSSYNNQRGSLSPSSGQDDDSGTETVGTRGATGTYKEVTEEVRKQQKELVKVGEYPAQPWQSEETYPKTLDCNGDYIYGDRAGQPIVHHQIPWDIPLVESAQKGVPNHYQMDNTETNDTWYYMVGIGVRNVYIPTEEELGKPLSKTRPWSLVYMPRDGANKSRFGQGLMLHTFVGDIQGVEHAVPKNGVNSRDYIDRHVGTDENHFGSDGDSQYVLLSPDCHFMRPALVANELYHNWDVSGSGFRHNLYAKGRDGGNIYQDRVDQRGTCQAVNLNQYSTGSGKHGIDGLGYAQGNKTVKAPKGVDRPLCNMYRERSVYMQVQGMGAYNDNSFVMDGLNHERHVTDANAAIVTLLKDNPAQYGRLEGAGYVDTGVYGLGSATTAELLTGDSFVGMWSPVRKAYISNLIGNDDLDPPQHIYTALQKLFAMDDCTRLPLTGDRDDRKNFANGYPGQDFPNAGGASQSVYLPKVLKTMTSFVVESDVNLHRLELGDPRQGEVHYPWLKDLYIGSDVPKGTAWEDSWLNQFYCEVRRPSKWKRVKAALVRALTFALPITIMASGGFSVESMFDIQHSLVRGLAALFLYYTLDKSVFSTRTVKRFFDIPICDKDEWGGMDFDECIRNWHDIYDKYNGDFSVKNRIVNYLGIPDPYNVCHCNDCHPLVHTQELLFSNPQSPESQLDSYSNFQANAYASMLTHSGKVQDMFQLGNQLYMQTTDNIWPINYVQNETALTEQSIGLQSPFRVGDPMEVLGGLDEGIYGTLDANSGINTPLGHFFIDNQAKSIYQFNGGSFKEIVSGLGRFFEEHIDFCSSYSCRDEKAPNGVGYNLGWDPKTNRLLISKRDGEYGFTVSFDPNRGEFISLHSYVPQFFVWNRRKLFAVEGNALWEHDAGEGFNNYYGKQYDFEVGFTVNKGDIGLPFKTTNLKVFTEANDLARQLKRLPITFDKIAVYNTNQSTGWMTMVPGENDPGNMQEDVLDRGRTIRIKREKTYWNVSRFKDYHVDKSSAVITQEECVPYEEVTNNKLVDHLENPSFEDNYFGVRLKLDDAGKKNVELNLYKVDSIVQYFENDIK